jgi:uncharacterized membrane protein YedE/YeeE
MPSKPPKPYLNPYMGGTLIGLALFLAFYITGSGLGASAAIARIQVAILDLLSPDHVDRVAYFAEMGGGSLNPLDHSSVFMLLGTVLGGMVSGLLTHRFRPELNKGPNVSVRNRVLFAFVGGAIVGYGARLARGCTSGQALSGGAVLSVGSFAFMFAVFAGAYALAYFARRLWN